VDIFPVGGTPAQLRDIRPVHGEDQIEIVKILEQYLAGALPGNVDAMCACGGDRASIGRFSLMPAADAGGIDAEGIAKACLIHDMAEYSLGKWRAADIAHANKEDADTFHLRTWRRMEGAWHEKGKAGKTGDQPIAWRAQGLDTR